MTTKRWRLQFTMRTALLLVGALSVYLGILVNRAQRQRKAVEVILSREGMLAYHHEYDSTGGHTPDAVQPGPEWLRSLIGAEYFDSVKTVALRNAKIRDHELEYLAGLPDLEGLLLNRTPITDEGITHLRHLDNLIKLDLTQTSITDDGLAALTRLSHLRELTLNGTNISDASIATLLDMPALREVRLIGTNVTHDGVSRLIEGGKEVYCLLDPTLHAVDQSGNAVRSVRAGTKVQIQGTFRVPERAKATNIVLIVSIVAVRSDGSHVIMQQGFANVVNMGQGKYSFEKSLDLKSPKRRPYPGLLTLEYFGIPICETPLEQLRPVAMAD